MGGEAGGGEQGERGEGGAGVGAARHHGGEELGLWVRAGVGY